MAVAIVLCGRMGKKEERGCDKGGRRKDGVTKKEGEGRQRDGEGMERKGRRKEGIESNAKQCQGGREYH